VQPELTSSTLLEQARGNNEAAWQRLVQLYSPLVQHWCRRCGVSQNEVPDVAQEVFLSVSLALADFERQRAGSFRTWMRAIARHKALDHFRKRKGDPSPVGGTLGAEMAQSIPDQISAEEDADEVGELYRRALELIKSNFEENTWRAFWRTTVDGHATDIVASELGLSAVAVRIAKSRVLARLREDLGDLIA
jgi:RNA polymerase sigma-70 factor (ECF subfamily)